MASLAIIDIKRGAKSELSYSAQAISIKSKLVSMFVTSNNTDSSLSKECYQFRHLPNHGGNCW